MNRKTTPKVRDGRVQKKNRHDLTPTYWNTRQNILQIDIENPGKGYKNFLKKRDIIQFLEILPHWEEIESEFDAVLLAPGGDSDGWYLDGVVAICAWEKNMTSSLNTNYFNNHKELFDRLGVKYEIRKNYVICHFTEDQIKAYQLLHILLHEIGHHHDRINTKSKRGPSNGEPYAESYAFKYEKIIWNKYFDTFDK